MARIVLNNKGFRQLRTDPKVREFVQDQAEKVADAAVAMGADVEAEETESPRNRARSAVIGSAYDSEKMLRALGSRIGRP